jgi:hypothetical protein
MVLSLVVNINPSVATIKNGIPIVRALSDTVRVVKNEGIPTTARTLKVFDPKILPSAIECFPAIADRTDIISSGRLVPIATASIVIIDGEIFNSSQSCVTDSIVYFAPINIPIIPKTIYTIQIFLKSLGVDSFSSSIVLSERV